MPTLFLDNYDDPSAPPTEPELAACTHCMDGLAEYDSLAAVRSLDCLLPEPHGSHEKPSWCFRFREVVVP